jgi:hypothetical protein
MLLCSFGLPRYCCFGCPPYDYEFIYRPSSIFRMAFHLLVFLILIFGCFFMALASSAPLDHCDYRMSAPLPVFVNDPSVSLSWIPPILPDVLHFYPQPVSPRLPVSQ